MFLQLLLSEGHTMYFGEAAEAVPYFASIGYKCPSVYNPADFYLELVRLKRLGGWSLHYR